MTAIQEQIETRLAPDRAFAFVADFANAAAWDPGTESAERLDPGPVGIGARYRLAVRVGPRVIPMEYRITDHDAPRRVVLVGTGSGVTSHDDIRFEPAPGGGTRIDYRAEITLGGLLALIQPLLGSAFRNLGRRTAEQMRTTLDAQAGATLLGDAREGAQP